MRNNGILTITGSSLYGNRVIDAGGGGVEWYFGYLNHNNDLNCKDWRSRDRVWDFTSHALTFFNEHLPFDEMESQDELISDEQQYCFAKTGEVYAVYLPVGGSATLDLSGQSGSFEVKWYDPRSGGGLQDGSVSTVEGGTSVSLGNPPADAGQDWAVLVSKS